MKLENKLTALYSLIMVVGILVSGWYDARGLSWLLIAVLMLIFMLVLGWETTGRPMGILINERNLMSLSRFQIIVWTLIILSAYFTISLARIKAGIEDPLAVAIDPRLWALLGISTASLVGTPLIYSNKKRKQPHDASYKSTSESLSAHPEIDEQYVKDHSVGLLYANREPDDAQFRDMFEGDELDNTAYVDMSKVQMFFFTIITAVAYIVLLKEMMGTLDPSKINAFPDLPNGLLAILGISHAGYLGSKSVDHTKPKA